MLHNTENLFTASLDEKTGADLKVDPTDAEAKQLDSSDKENKMEAKGLRASAQWVTPSGSEPSVKVVRSRQTSELRRRSRSQSRATSASSVSSSRSSSSRLTESSCSSGSCGRRCRSSCRHGYRRSRSGSSSRSRSRPRPRCHRAAPHSRCSRRRHRSPPCRYRAHSRSYSRSPSPRRYRRKHRTRSTSRSLSLSRSRSRSAGRRLYGFMGRARFISSSHRRSRSRSRSPIGANIRLSLDDKRELLKIAQANAAKALGVETLELPASVKPILSAPEEPSHLHRMRLEGVVPRNMVEQHKGKDAEDEVPSPKTSPRNKIITFSIHNSVAKPTASKPSSSPESPAGARPDTVTGSPYGQWVPIKARSFPVLGHKR